MTAWRETERRLLEVLTYLGATVDYARGEPFIAHETETLGVHPVVSVSELAEALESVTHSANTARPGAIGSPPRSNQ